MVLQKTKNRRNIGNCIYFIREFVQIINIDHYNFHNHLSPHIL